MEDNSYMNSSRLRPPSRIASPGKGLFEISEAQGNARSMPPSKMLPPGTLKREMSTSGDERDPKQRRTLATKAGEFPLASNIPNVPRSSVKGTSLVSAAKPGFAHLTGSNRYESFSSSTSSRTTSASSRTTSNGSFASSIGPGVRPKSSYGRPQTSMAFSQSTTTRPLTTSKTRPTTAMDNHPSDIGMSGQGTRNGMRVPSLPISIQSPGESTLQSRKVRSAQSIHSNGSQRLTYSQRDVSVSTAFSRLQIHGEEDGEHQATSNILKKPSTMGLCHKPSINTGMRNLKLHNDEKTPSLTQVSGDNYVAPKTPSHIPVRKTETLFATPAATPSKTPRTSPQKPQYLTKDSNIPGFVAFETEKRLENMEQMFLNFKNSVDSTSKERTAIEDAMNVYKTRIAELESIRIQLSSSNTSLQTDLDDARQKLGQMSQTVLMANAAIDEQLRSSRIELEEARRDYRNEVDHLRRENSEEVDRIVRQHREDLRERERGSVTELEERIRELERRNDAKLEDERSRRLREVEDLQRQMALEQQNLAIALQKKDLEFENMRGQLEEVKGELDREQTLKCNAQKELAELRETLQKTGATTSSTIQSLEAIVASLRARIHYLESDSQAQSDSYAEMESRMQEAVRSAEVSKQKLIKEETLRRILFNQVQELKGNIRVMCRVRPVLENGSDGDAAKLKFPDTDKEGKELEILGKEEKSSLGNVTRKPHSFTFDRVFGPESQNQGVFEEISQLVQSALDGYNVCIFCYGQTGSGKTHTMSSADGMIPRATQQIYETATNLKDKGWSYSMEGSFVEVYNEEIHDLLSNSKDADKKKHEIRHDEQKKQTTITGLRTVTLDSPDTVESILKQAAANRSVAATKSNERSSRSHSVFILKLVGRNSTTGETSEGTLNLVDLAGSERLKQSGAEGDRMKETQNINKSLSCLGDVIGALGQGKEGAHIPYRNSKLTYLLQYSLGGNSKTLMFTMISPMEANLSETLTSLKFATKVHNTHIGTAKKNTKIRE